MQDPVEMVKRTETFRKLDQKVNWAMVTIFGTVTVLVIYAVAENVLVA
ncbi:hypothetical protein [Ferruginivarius sediminum]|jgi:hypothetical protein|nr:hypothetical protein [Ferruginivarius sediminum]